MGGSWTCPARSQPPNHTDPSCISVLPHSWVTFRPVRWCRLCSLPRAGSLRELTRTLTRARGGGTRTGVLATLPLASKTHGQQQDWRLRARAHVTAQIKVTESWCLRTRADPPARDGDKVPTEIRTRVSGPPVRGSLLREVGQMLLFVVSGSKRENLQDPVGVLIATSEMWNTHTHTCVHIHTNQF